jgi:hypothetical protein
MTAATSSTGEASLLFNWAPPRSRKLAIAAFLGASLLLHAFCFYLFQIVYTPAVVLLPPPARVTLLTANSEEGRNLLRWVDAEDPALASATLRPPDAKQRPLPRVQHIPSYIAEEPKLKHAPPLAPETRAPSVHPPGPVPVSPSKPPPASGPIPTRVSFSEELSAFGAANFPPIRFAASNNESPQAVRFRIGVNEQGEVRFCFPLDSSGDRFLDEQARQHLVLGRFGKTTKTTSGGEEPLVWGIATIEWGNDVSRPADASNRPPAP